MSHVGALSAFSKLQSTNRRDNAMSPLFPEETWSSMAAVHWQNAKRDPIVSRSMYIEDSPLPVHNGPRRWAERLKQDAKSKGYELKARRFRFALNEGLGDKMGVTKEYNVVMRGPRSILNKIVEATPGNGEIVWINKKPYLAGFDAAGKLLQETLRPITDKNEIDAIMHPSF